MDREISYQEYRKHMSDLTFKKNELLKTVNKRKESHSLYVKYYKEYSLLKKQEKELQMKLILLIPDNWF